MDALIVDDDDLMADLLETVVAGLHSSIVVHKATGFAEALALWRNLKPRLLMVDWNLPDGSGLDLVRQVRATDASAAVVMITGRADRESILKAAHYNINGYISKPFNVELLHERLVDMIGEVLPVEPSAQLHDMLSAGLNTVIQLPAKVNPASVLALMKRTNDLSAAEYQRQAEAVAISAQRIALAMGKQGPQYYTAGLLSRMGELAVLKVMDQYLRQGGSLVVNEVTQDIAGWAQRYGNQLKIQWLLPLVLRQLTGAVHVLSRETVTQDLLIMRAGALLADDAGIKGAECSRLLRHLGLEEWHRPHNNDGVIPNE